MSQAAGDVKLENAPKVPRRPTDPHRNACDEMRDTSCTMPRFSARPPVISGFMFLTRVSLLDGTAVYRAGLYVIYSTVQLYVPHYQSIFY